MGTKPAKPVNEPVEEPKSALPETRDLGAGVDRKPTVAKEPADTFDERTGAGTPPWQNEDGTQNTGSEDTEEDK